MYSNPRRNWWTVTVVWMYKHYTMARENPCQLVTGYIFGYWKQNILDMCLFQQTAKNLNGPICKKKKEFRASNFLILASILWNQLAHCFANILSLRVHALLLHWSVYISIICICTINHACSLLATHIRPILHDHQRDRYIQPIGYIQLQHFFIWIWCSINTKRHL